MHEGDGNDWDVEVYVVEDSNGDVLGHSQSTEAYEVYGLNPDLAERVAAAQGITYEGGTPEDYALHFGRTAETRAALEAGLQKGKGNK